MRAHYNQLFEAHTDAFIMVNHPAGGTASKDSGPVTITSRFGDVEVDPSKSLHFPRGLLGMPDRFRFGLVNFPSEKMQQFMLLQSLEETSLSFITLPLPLQNAIISREDLTGAARELQIAEDDLVTLVIVSVHRSLAEVKLSVNARAPLLIDATRRMGVQYVFHTDAYKVQHML